MAVTVNQISDAATSPYRRVFEIIATADADTTANITTGLTVSQIQPAAGPNVDCALMILIEPISPFFYVSQWIVTSRTASSNTVVVMTKKNAFGSGDAAVQIRVT